ncbi:MAG: YggT family protein [Gemmatimonadaceae bacterium]
MIAIETLAALTAALRIALLIGGGVLVTIAALDWGVRTRRINPFSGIARFMRARVEPRLVGIERQVMRAGGHQSSTPWWAVVAYVVCGVLLLALADLLTSLVRDAVVATSMGGAGLLLLIVRWTFGFLQFALLVRVIASWFPSLATRRWVSWSFGATEWMLRPLRRLLPSMGVIDITPIVAYFALWLAERVVTTVLVSLL